MTETSHSGRPREFDHASVLDAAVDVFWRRGFGATSMRELETELGISQSSIYNAYGSKRRLLEAALDRYEARVCSELVTPLGSTGGVDAVVEFLDSLQRWVTDGGNRGCLVINLMVGQSDDPDLARRTGSFRDRLRRALVGAFRAEPGVTDGEATSYAELILTVALGLSVASRGGASTAELTGMVQATQAHVRRWRPHHANAHQILN